MADIVVIGGGIHGCSAAFHLARRGASVIVLEKDTLGRHASGVNAGGVRQIFRALPEIPLSVAAMRMWEHIADLLDDDCGFIAQGHVFVAETDEEAAERYWPYHKAVTDQLGRERGWPPLDVAGYRASLSAGGSLYVPRGLS